MHSLKVCEHWTARYDFIMPHRITPAEFVEKWSKVELSERAASQEHFIDLCRMLGQPTPAEHDATGAEYTFEKGVTPLDGASPGAKGDRGFADVWWRGKFAWEYKRKGKYKDLAAAYKQLQQYREALENPPLLIVSDITRTEIHTNFTGTAKELYVIKLADIANAGGLGLLRRVFADPESFKPAKTTAQVTVEIAEQFATIAKSLRQFGKDAHTTAHFLMKCMFCLFAEDVELLPKALFKKLVDNHRSEPKKLAARMTELFNVMRTGGDFGADSIKHFNGGLFDDAPALQLTSHDIGSLMESARSDWGSVEPAIFGTLFERTLDPNTRAKIGAHYTSRDDIMLVVEPVVMAPLRREWEAVKLGVEAQLEKRRAATEKRAKAAADKKIDELLREFVHRLSTVRILDPACGSGNFLYVAIQQLLTLEKEVITFAGRSELGLGRFFPSVRPTQLYGIEINPYAAELAQVVIWIGYLQWMRDNGYIDGIRIPILETLQTIENRDAILDLSNAKHPKPATWPDADFIIGNPPFLGDKVLRRGLGSEYVETLWSVYDTSIPRQSDLCCYWFEIGRAQLERKRAGRIGLLATQAIRNDAARTVLERIKSSGDIFMAWSDREWVLDGAHVHVSMIGFDNGNETTRTLNDSSVSVIHADLTAESNTTKASGISENESLSFLGSCKGGPFDIPLSEARLLLEKGGNPRKVSNVEVLRPVVNSRDLLGRHKPRWIIDNADKTLAEAAQYQAVHSIVEQRVKPERDTNRDRWLRENWWRPQRMRPEMRSATENLSRFIVTPTTAKYRMFAWMHPATLPDHQLIVFARSDDYFFGVLHSSIHELWARRMGTQLREAESGFRYTPTTCFETFPLPWPPGKEPVKNAAYKRIAKAAKELNEQRERWLNPPEWIEPIAKAVDREDKFSDVPKEARELIRQSAIMARAAKDGNLKKRTLTNLYNERPTWLKLAHLELDGAVLAAYAAVDAEGEWDEDWAEVWVDSGAGFPLPANHKLTDRRKVIDQKVLANLLRMNLERA